MRLVHLSTCAGFAGVFIALAPPAQAQCDTINSEMTDLEARLAASRAGKGRGLLAGLAGAALRSTPYASLGAGPVADAVVDEAQSTARDATLEAIRGDGAEAPAEASSDPKADRARLRELRREAKSQGCR